MKQYCVNKNVSLLECMEIIQKAAAGIALAINDDQQLVGTVSDGDIRNALLQGNSLDSSIYPHINQQCFSVNASVSRAEILDIMHARWFEQVPIVDYQNRVIGLHLLHDIVGKEIRPNWAFVMAGGKGTRLRPFTENVPKPMIKVAGRPILERIILHLVSYGIQKVFISVNYLSNVIEDYFQDGTAYGIKIEYIREKTALGSGGSLSLLPEQPRHPMLVMNGDLILDANYAEMIKFHLDNKCHATMGVYSYFHEVPYGCIEIEGNKLVRIEEKPVLEKKVNAGIYVLSPAAIASIPQKTAFPITTLFEEAITKNLTCGTFNIEKEWLDIGTPQQLSLARGE